MDSAELVVVLAATWYLLAAREAMRRAAPKRTVPRSDGYWKTVVPALSDNLFRRDFRMPRAVFKLIASEIGKDRCFQYHPAHTARALAPEICLAVVILRLAYGMTYANVASKLAISEGSVDNASARALQALINRYGRQMVSDKWPQTSEQFQKGALTVSRHGRAVLPGAFAVIDGTHMRVFASRYPPGVTKQDYVDKKAVASITMQCVVNGNMQFIDVCGGMSGASHDSTILRFSPLGQKAADAVPAGYYILGDSGYPLKKWMVVPFKEGPSGQAPAHRSFNFLLSSTRMVVERSFGVLKARFRGLLHALQLKDVTDSATWFHAAVILHNICRELGESDNLLWLKEIGNKVETSEIPMTEEDNECWRAAFETGATIEYASAIPDDGSADRIASMSAKEFRLYVGANIKDKRMLAGMKRGREMQFADGDSESDANEHDTVSEPE